MKKVIIFVIVLAFTAGLCAEFDFYGSLRSGWWYMNQDEDYTGEDSGRMEFDSYLSSISRAGFKFSKGDFCTKVELGLSGSGISLRHAYATQDMGSYKLLAGKTFTGFSDFAAQGFGFGSELMLRGIGMLYDGSKNMIKVTMENGVYIALIEPVKMDPTWNNLDGVDALLPKINIGAHLTLNDIEIHPTFGFAMSSYNDEFSSYDETVTAYAAAITAKYKLNDISLKGQLGFGQNIGDYGFMVASSNSYAGWDVDEVVDATTMNFYLQGTFQAFTGGFGYVSADHDGLDDPDTDMSLFVQYKMKLGDYLCLMPEIGTVNFMENGMGDAEGAMTYFGTVLRVDIP